MKLVSLAACGFFALSAASVWGGSPFEAFKDKLKPGLYEYKIDADMSGAGMGRRTMTMKHCLSEKDIEQRGGYETGQKRKGGDKCDVRNFKMSGNTASYTMDCPAQQTAVDTAVVFGGDSFKMDARMSMSEGGQTMKATQHMEAKYLGPCNK